MKDGSTFRSFVVLVAIAFFFFVGSDAQAEDTISILELLVRLLALLA